MRPVFLALLSPHAAAHCQHRSALVISVVAETPPGPLFRLQHQSTFHRIAMHIVQLLFSLVFAPDHEVIESALPDVADVECFFPQTWLVRWIPLAPLCEQMPREALL